MPNKKRVIYSRIGRCRSDRPFDIPHDFVNESLADFWGSFSVSELVDVFCMTEAMFSRHQNNLEDRPEADSLRQLNSYFRTPAMMLKIESELTLLGLKYSPMLVRHGQALLLG